MGHCVWWASLVLEAVCTTFENIVPTVYWWLGRLPVLTGAKSQRPKATSARGSACCKGGSDMELYDQADFRCQIYWSRHECCVEGLATSIGEPQSRPLGFWIKNTLTSQRIMHYYFKLLQKEAPAMLLDLNKNWVSDHGASSNRVIGTAHQELGVVSWST